MNIKKINYLFVAGLLFLLTLLVYVIGFSGSVHSDETTNEVTPTQKQTGFAFFEGEDTLTVEIDLSELDSQFKENEDGDFVISYIGPENIPQTKQDCHDLGWLSIQDRAKQIVLKDVENQQTAGFSLSLRSNLTRDYGFCFLLVTKQTSYYTSYVLQKVDLAEKKEAGEFKFLTSAEIEGTNIPATVTIKTVEGQSVDSDSWQYALVETEATCSSQNIDEDVTFKDFDQEAQATTASLSLDEDFADSVLCVRAIEEDSEDSYIYDALLIAGILETEDENNIDWIIIVIALALIGIILYATLKGKKDNDSEEKKSS